MKQLKYLVRAGVSPLHNLTVREALDTKNDMGVLGGNSGNLVFQYGLWRALMREDVVLRADNLYIETGRFTDEDIAIANREYDAYILPMADIFRDTFLTQLGNLTRFIERLEIPVVLVGCCVRGKDEKDIRERWTREPGMVETARRFCDAVLRRSVNIGVRGEATRRFLTDIVGVRGDRVDIIGCPSMYTFGPLLNINPVDTFSNDIIIGNNVRDPRALPFLRSCIRGKENWTSVNQRVDELRRMTDGRRDIDDPFQAPGHQVFYLNWPTWNGDLMGSGLSVGMRIHGSIMALLAHVPALQICVDVRTKELCDFHKIPYIMEDETDGRTLESVIEERGDWHATQTVHALNFKIYTDFLHRNGLKTIWDDGWMDDSPLNIRLEEETYDYLNISQPVRF